MRWVWGVSCRRLTSSGDLALHLHLHHPPTNLSVISIGTLALPSSTSPENSFQLSHLPLPTCPNHYRPTWLTIFLCPVLVIQLYQLPLLTWPVTFIIIDKLRYHRPPTQRTYFICQTYHRPHAKPLPTASAPSLYHFPPVHRLRISIGTSKCPSAPSHLSLGGYKVISCQQQIFSRTRDDLSRAADSFSFILSSIVLWSAHQQIWVI